MHGQFFCDPKTLSITFTRDPKTLDGCLNGGLVIGSFKYMMNNKQLDENSA